MIRISDYIVNMRCMDKSSCPTLFLPKLIEWNLPDPKGKLIDAGRQATPEQVENIKERLGLDRPFLVQILDFANQVFLHFNFGSSFLSQTPVRETAAQPVAGDRILGHRCRDHLALHRHPDRRISGDQAPLAAGPHGDHDRADLLLDPDLRPRPDPAVHLLLPVQPERG